jgi:hypothetical protein
MSGRKELGTNKWKRQRLLVLRRDNNQCYVCGGIANAVDHLIPAAKGGESTLDNLRAICTKCNSVKGSRSKPLFLASSFTPPALIEPLSPNSDIFVEPESITPNLKESEPIVDLYAVSDLGAIAKPLIGSTIPRISTPRLHGKSLGNDFDAFVKSCGMELMPWQKYCADDFLQIDDEGKFIKRTVSLLVSRQQGKTTLAALLIAFHLFELGTMSVIGISSMRNMARDTFDKVTQIIEDNPHLAEKVKLTHRSQIASHNNGMERITLKSGAIYQIVAATTQGARGKSAGLLFVDELRHVTPEAWQAAKPVTIAQPNSVTLVASNSGTAFSTVLNDLRERALSNPPKTLGWYEYSAPPEARLDDRSGWAAANPALSYRLHEADILEAMNTTDVDTFRQEHLCQWVTSNQSPWPHMAFEDLTDTELVIGAGPETYFAFDVGHSRLNASLVIGQFKDDKIAVKILQQWNSDSGLDETAIAVAIKEHADIYFPRLIAYDHYASASIAEKLALSGQQLVDVVGQQAYQAAMDLLDAIVTQKLVHADGGLVAHMNACAAKRNDAGFRLVRRTSSSDISAAISLSMLVNQMNKPRSTPSIII